MKELRRLRRAEVLRLRRYVKAKKLVRWKVLDVLEAIRIKYIEHARVYKRDRDYATVAEIQRSIKNIELGFREVTTLMKDRNIDRKNLLAVMERIINNNI